MLLSNLKFASFLSYNTKSEEHKDLVSAIKNDTIKNGLPISGVIAKEVKEKIKFFPDFFGREVYLVPVPKSSLMQLNTLWVPKRFAEELAKLGMGKIFDCLKRKQAVRKSSQSDPKERPKPIDHYNSLSVKSTLEKPKNILLVDDVITRGSTLLGCASKLQEAFPDVKIKAFVSIRAISNPSNFKKIEDMHMGEITLFKDGTCSTN